jgi:NAD dependent epimerase/dehydratase family enzyme
MDALAGVDAVIHLAGAGVGDKRWTKKYKSEILNSRLLGTTTIAKAVAIVKPQVFISSSAIGWYSAYGALRSGCCGRDVYFRY